MSAGALKKLLKKAKISFSKAEEKPDLIEKALQSPAVMAIVEEEAIAQGEHIEGVKVDVEKVDGSFVNIDSSMLVSPQDTEQTPVRHSRLTTSTGLSILTMTSSGFASHTTGNPSVRAFMVIVHVSSDTL